MSAVFTSFSTSSSDFFKSTLDTNLSTLVVDDDSQVLQKVFNSMLNNEIDTGCLPPGVRFLYPGLIVFEKPPTKKLIQYLPYSLSEMEDSEEAYYNEEEEVYEEVTPIDLEGNLKVFEVPIPWQLYIITYSTSLSSMYHVTSVKMFFMNTSLLGQDTNLYSPYIPNFYLDGHMCPPRIESSDEILRYPQNVEGAISCAYDWVWNTGFNRDLVETIYSTADVDNPLMQELNSSFYNPKNIPTFYNFMSKKTLEEVTSCSWLNPSYFSYHNRDPIYLYRIPFYYDMFVDYVNKNPYRYAHLSDEEKYSLGNFSDWFGNSFYKQKTFADIIQFFIESYKHVEHEDHVYYFHHILNSVSSLNLNFNQFVNNCHKIMGFSS
jgi:hypothetical protein